MKHYTNLLCLMLAAMVLATSCKKDDKNDEPKPEPTPQEEEKDYATVPINISVGITPMSGNIEGVDLKNAFATGDVIEITNSQVLYEPLSISTEGFEGKSAVTFKGEMKIKKNLELASNHLFTAVLKNGNKYNHGKPFKDARELTSIAEEIEQYSYWVSENFAYSSDAISISLAQTTQFVDIDIYNNQISLKAGNAELSKIIDGKHIYAAPFGVQLTISGLGVDETFDKTDKSFHRISASVPEECLRSLFSIGEGKTVFFGKGNLQYRPLDGKWRLAPYQYHRCFKQNDEVEDGYANWMGDDKWTEIFWWGAWTEGGRPDLANDDTPEDYNVPLDADGNISAPCAYGKQWTVLTDSEWEYLLNKRADAVAKRFGAVVEGVSGVLVLPDVWATPEGIPPFVTEFDVNDEEDIPNRYSAEEWLKMEAAGALFLPDGFNWMGSLGVFSFYYDYQTRTKDQNGIGVCMFYIPHNSIYDPVSVKEEGNTGWPCAQTACEVRLVQANETTAKVE